MSLSQYCQYCNMSCDWHPCFQSMTSVWQKNTAVNTSVWTHSEDSTVSATLDTNFTRTANDAKVQVYINNSQLFHQKSKMSPWCHLQLFCFLFFLSITDPISLCLLDQSTVDTTTATGCISDGRLQTFFQLWFMSLISLSFSIPLPI